MTQDKTGIGGRLFRLFTNYGLYISFLVIFGIFAYLAPAFLDTRNIINIPYQVSYIAIIAVGITFVIITGGIDLSVGSVVALVGVWMVYVIAIFHVPVLLGLIIGLATGAFLGIVNGSFVVRFNIPPFIATLAMMSVARGLARFIVNDRSITIQDPMFKFIGDYRIGGSVPMPVVIMLVVFAAAYIVTTRTRFGRYVYAIGGNVEAARLSGINTRFVTLMVYVICAGLSGLSGILLASRFPGGAVGDPKVGLMYELDAIASVVVGGTSLMGGKGTIIGTLVGALLIGVLNNGLNLLAVPDYWQMVFKGVVILAAVLMDQLKK